MLQFTFIISLNYKTQRNNKPSKMNLRVTSFSPKYHTFSLLFYRDLILYWKVKYQNRQIKISKSLKKQGKRQISFGPTYRYTCICWFLFEHYQNTILVKFNIINSQCKLLLQIIVRGCFKASKLNWRPNEKLLYESFCIFRPFCPLIAL